MGRIDEIKKVRLKKIEELKSGGTKGSASLGLSESEGVLPYAYRFDKKDSCLDLQKKYEGLKADSYTKDSVKVAGRIIIKREFGRLSFLILQDNSAKIQLIFQKGETREEILNFLKKFLDVGDIIGVEGFISKTKKGELSIIVQKLKLLTKAILPLPEKWFGLKDNEERYRKRYLDLIMNPKEKEVFIKRAKILKALRDFMDEKKFIEVETPLLQNVYGGANAKPFKTHFNTYNSEVFLSIAPELYLKKAIVGGFDRVYEITKKFRNEGVDRQHNPEHMTIEWYQGYADYKDGMETFKEAMKAVVKKLFGKLTFEYQGEKINLNKWEVIPLLEAIKKYVGVDVDKIKNDIEAKKIAEEHGIDSKAVTKVNLPDELMKLFREKLIQPTFLIDYPKDLAPLSKRKKDDPTKAEVFQAFIGGIELCRAYSELNDPLLQKKNFEEQEEERKKGNKEFMPTDKSFVDALSYGMPPTCGVGIGIERLVMLFTNKRTIQEVILFPFMKTKNE